MKLRFLDGPFAGRIVDLHSDDMSIGREADCDIVLNEDGVSRRHARILRDGDDFVLEDLDSRNGVRINGQRIKKTQTLKSQDRIGISSRILLFIADDAVQAMEKKAPPQIASPKPAGTVSPPRSNGPLYASVAVVIAVIVLLVIWRVGQWSPVEPTEPGPDVTNVHPINDTGGPDLGEPRTPREVDTDTGGDSRSPGPTHTRPQLGHYLLKTLPPGADVILNERSEGLTPLLLQRLPVGSHKIRLEKPGYRSMKRVIFIPQTDRSFDQPFELTQESGTCLISSKPVGAAVMLGRQVLGRTPYAVSGFDPGEYELRVVQFGYEIYAERIIISNHRATSMHADLKPNLGSVQVVTLPAPARVFIDGHLHGLSEPAQTGDRRSRPLRIEGLKSGDYSVHMEYGGKVSAAKKVRIESGVMGLVRVTVWSPDTEVTLIDGTVVRGMLKRLNVHGDLLVATSATQDVTIVATRVKDIREIVAKEEQSEDERRDNF